MEEVSQPFTPLMLVLPLLALLGLAVSFYILKRGGAASRPNSEIPLPPQIISDPLLNQEIQRLLAQDKKLEAVKRVRERTGMSLKESKDYVEALPSGTPFASQGTAQPSFIEESLPLDDEVRALLARGSKIDAIKRVRERTGLGLKESKDYVEALERR